MPVSEFDFQSNVVRQHLVCVEKGWVFEARDIAYQPEAEVAGVQQLDRDVMRQLSMSEMKHWLEQVLLQVRHAAFQSHTIKQ